MASPAVATQTEGAVTTAGTTHTITFPASSASGNLIVCFFASASQTTHSAGDSFSTLQLNPEAGNPTFSLFYKQIDGSEGGDFVVTTGASTKSAWTIHRITGHLNPATQAPDKSTIATGTDAAPNPDAVTVTGGADDILVLASYREAGEEADDDTACNSQPSGYTWVAGTAGHQKSTGTATAATSNVLLATAYLGFTAASSEDPGTFGKDLTNAWAATTVAIRSTAPPVPTIPYLVMARTRT